MARQSERLRAQENGDVPPPAPANWQEIIANLEARVQRAEEEARLARRQAPPPVPVAEVPPVQAQVVAPPQREVHREPLYERFRKQHPPTFDGNADPLKAEQWLDMLTSILKFMGIEGNDRVACAVHTFRDDARIWWGVVTQIRNEETMTWEEFREVFMRNTSTIRFEEPRPKNL